MSIKYLLVDFVTPSGLETGVIPDTWWEEDMAYYPPYYSDGTKLEKAIKKAYTPEENWPNFKIIVRGSYGSYYAAVDKIEKALETDNLETTSDEALGRHHRKRFPNGKYLAIDYVTQPRASQRRAAASKEQKKSTVSSTDEESEEDEPAKLKLSQPPVKPKGQALQSSENKKRMSSNVTEMALPDGGQISSMGKRATKRNHKDPAAASSIGTNLVSVDRSSTKKGKKNAKEPKVKNRKLHSTNTDESEEENQTDDVLSLDDPNNNLSTTGFSPKSSKNSDRQVALVESPTSSPIGNAGMKKTLPVRPSSDTEDRQVAVVQSGSSSTSSPNGIDGKNQTPSVTASTSEKHKAVETRTSSSNGGGGKKKTASSRALSLMVRQNADILNGISQLARENEAREIVSHRDELDVLPVKSVKSSLGLPITSVDDFKVFNESLLEKMKQQKYAQFIRGIGGASIQLAIQKAWKEILTNRAAMGMNFYGNKRKEEKKYGIGKRRTSILLRDTLRRMPKYSAMTDDDFYQGTYNFLRHAKQRFKSEMKRLEQCEDDEDPFLDEDY